MPRFTKVNEGPGPAGASWESDWMLDLGNGHTVTRHDSERRMAGGRKGRAAMVDVHRTLECSCGGHVNGGERVADDLARLPHFDSAAEREAHEAEQAALRERILRSLGMDR